MGAPVIGRVPRTSSMAVVLLLYAAPPFRVQGPQRWCSYTSFMETRVLSALPLSGCDLVCPFPAGLQ